MNFIFELYSALIFSEAKLPDNSKRHLTIKVRMLNNSFSTIYDSFKASLYSEGELLYAVLKDLEKCETSLKQV